MCAIFWFNYFIFRIRFVEEFMKRMEFNDFWISSFYFGNWYRPFVWLIIHPAWLKPFASVQSHNLLKYALLVTASKYPYIGAQSRCIMGCAQMVHLFTPTAVSHFTNSIKNFNTNLRSPFLSVMLSIDTQGVINSVWISKAYIWCYWGRTIHSKLPFQ